MNDERDREHDEDGTPGLETWGSRWNAPPALRRATLDAARQRGLVRGGSMTSRGRWWATAAVIAAVAFAAGFGLGARRAPEGGTVTVTAPPTGETAAAPAAGASAKYALFLFEDRGYRNAEAGRESERVAEYAGWARSLAEAGRFVDGEKLADDGRACRMEHGALAARGPQSDPERGRLTGYFVIGAASLEEAMRVAGTCPHLKYGGSLEIRMLETT